MNIIVAVNSDWGIGYDGVQTNVIPQDRAFFKRMTEGGVVIAGRKTYDELRKPLLNRKNIILTRDQGFTAEGIVIAHTIDDVVRETEKEDQDNVFVIGGAEIYAQFLPLCTRAFVTKIDASPPSDAFFPNLDRLESWSIERRGEKKQSFGLDFSLVVYRNDALLGYSYFARG